MNQYKYEDLEIGMEEGFCIEMTEHRMENFLDITGDINPLHNDENFAKEAGYEGKVVYGMLTASLLSTLAGVYLPGKYSLIHQTEVKFVKPVYIGDQLKVSGKVLELNDTVKQMTMKVVITNQHQEKILRGKMKVGFLNER